MNEIEAAVEKEVKELTEKRTILERDLEKIKIQIDLLMKIKTSNTTNVRGMTFVSAVQKLMGSETLTISDIASRLVASQYKLTRGATTFSGMETRLRKLFRDNPLFKKQGLNGSTYYSATGFQP